MIPVLYDVENGNLWHDFLSVAFDPAHILAELFFTIVFDGVIIALLWGILFRRVILPRLRRQIHREIDQEHGIDHDAARPSDQHPHDHSVN